MSLTSMLKGKTERDQHFQSILRNLINTKPPFYTRSGREPFSKEYEELVPYSLSSPFQASLVGTGFDYLARFIIAKNINNKQDKKTAYSNLVAEKGLIKLEKTTDIETFKKLESKYEEGITKCEQFITNKEIDFNELISFSGYLASLENVLRSGSSPMDIKKSLLDDTDNTLTKELELLCEVFQSKFIDSGIIKGNSQVVFNPKFGLASMLCQGADADIFIDDTLYDFKCTKSRGYTWLECSQIFGYYLLEIIDRRCGGYGIGDDCYISKLAFYRGRFGEIETIEVESLDDAKVEQAIEELRKYWGLTFIV